MNRVGIGYDVHRFVDNRKLILGGVEIPHSQGLEGHSDADVLLHAISDALLGAAGFGDIGQHFPPSDETYRDMDSADILRHAIALLAESDWAVANIDATVIAEQPKVMPFADAMRTTIAEIVRVRPMLVSIKATTNEGMGFIGRGEGIAAIAVANIITGGETR